MQIELLKLILHKTSTPVPTVHQQPVWASLSVGSVGIDGNKFDWFCIRLMNLGDVMPFASAASNNNLSSKTPIHSAHLNTILSYLTHIFRPRSAFQMHISYPGHAFSSRMGITATKCQMKHCTDVLITRVLITLSNSLQSKLQLIR